MTPVQKRIAVQASIALGIVGVLVIGLVFFGFNISNITEKIVAAREELALRTTALQSLATLRADYTTKAQSYLGVLHNVVPHKDELIDLSKDFQTIASASELEYGFTFLGENMSTADSLGSVRFGLRLGGTLTNLLEFLDNLQNFRYLVQIESVSIFREESLMRMNLSGNVYFRQ